MNQKNKLKLSLLLCLNLLVIAALVFAFIPQQPQSDIAALSRLGSRGAEVKAIQQLLKDWSLYSGAIDGIYGPNTEKGVKAYQKIKGLTQDGIAGPATLKKMGITVGSMPAANTANINLLARIISAESRGESYTGQVAVGAVILNRIEHPSFPDTLSGVIYQSGAFTAVTDGQFNQPVADSSYKAAVDALNGQDPSGGAIYYYNPDKTSNQWIRSRPIIKRIGAHLFCS